MLPRRQFVPFLWTTYIGICTNSWRPNQKSVRLITIDFEALTIRRRTIASESVLRRARITMHLIWNRMICCAQRNEKRQDYITVLDHQEIRLFNESHSLVITLPENALLPF